MGGKEKAIDPNHVLPAGTFDGSRLQKIDAEVDLVATKLVVPDALPLESLNASLRLHDAMLKVAPLDFGFAGGTIASRVTLDAREPTLKSDVRIDLQRIRVDKLVPDSPVVAKGAGRVGATLQLKGTGNSIADAAAKADGHIAATVVNGRISNLLDAASGLNGGKVLALLAGGDKDIVIRCGGVAFDVKGGRGRSTLFLIDTEQTQVLGSGGFDLENERFDITVAPKPKEVGLLSLRTPVRLHGSFKQPDFEIVKGPLLARVGAAIAMAAATPFAALIPLVETGPGEESNCAGIDRAVKDAVKQAGAKPNRVPAK